MKNLKKGDWVFYEFELSQVVETEPNRGVTGISTGVIHIGGNHMENQCMPMTMDIKNISEHYAYASKSLHREGCGGLNYPEIANWLEGSWLACCHANLNNLKDGVVGYLNELEKFRQYILDAQRIDTPYGFPLLRPR